MIVINDDLTLLLINPLFQCWHESKEEMRLELINKSHPTLLFKSESNVDEKLKLYNDAINNLEKSSLLQKMLKDAGFNKLYKDITDKNTTVKSTTTMDQLKYLCAIFTALEKTYLRSANIISDNDIADRVKSINEKSKALAKDLKRYSTFLDSTISAKMLTETQAGLELLSNYQHSRTPSKKVKQETVFLTALYGFLNLWSLQEDNKTIRFILDNCHIEYSGDRNLRRQLKTIKKNIKVERGINFDYFLKTRSLK